MSGEPGTAYIPPTIGIGALRDGVAAAKCAAAGDMVGLHAIAIVTDMPRNVATVLAIITAEVCRRGGLDNDGTGRLLDEIKVGITDAILDQPRHERGAQEVMPDA